MKTRFSVGALIVCALCAIAIAQPPSPSATSTAPLFQDDFSNPASGWVAKKTDYGEFAYLDGEFRVLLNKADFNTYSILPTRGMGLWRGEFRGNFLGWRAPVLGPVHPKFVSLDFRKGQA